MFADLVDQIIVMKFGGTSLATTAHIANAAKHILRRKKEGYKVITVVSAMGQETDRLLGLIESVTDRDELATCERDEALALTSGELVSASLLSLKLQALGHPARAYAGWQLPIKTTEHLLSADIESIDTEELTSQLSRGSIPVVAGYQGINEELGTVTALGRGGSDTTAVAIASAVGAQFCEIFTDVTGVFDKDPQVHAATNQFSNLSYERMFQLAKSGAQVLHLKSIALAKKHQIPIHVRSSLVSQGGTWIVNLEAGEKTL